MKLIVLLSTICTLQAVYGGPVNSPNCHEVAKLSSDLNTATTYFRTINSIPSSTPGNENQNPTDNLVQGLKHIQEILEDISSINFDPQLNSFIIPQIQKRVAEQIVTLGAGSNTDNVLTEIDSLSKSLDRITHIFDESHLVDTCGENGLGKDSAQDNPICIVLQLLFDITYYGLSNLNGLGVLIYYISGLFSCLIRFH